MAPNQKSTSQIITFNSGCLLDTTHQLILQRAKNLNNRSVYLPWLSFFVINSVHFWIYWLADHVMQCGLSYWSWKKVTKVSVIITWIALLQYPYMLPPRGVSTAHRTRTNFVRAGNLANVLISLTPNIKSIDIKLCLWRMVEVSCFSTTTADAINTAKPCQAACDEGNKAKLIHFKSHLMNATNQKPNCLNTAVNV